MDVINLVVQICRFVPRPSRTNSGLSGASWESDRDIGR